MPVLVESCIASKIVVVVVELKGPSTQIEGIYPNHSYDSKCKNPRYLVFRSFGPLGLPP